MKLHMNERLILALTFIFIILQTPYTVAAEKPLVISNVDQGYFDKIQEDPRMLIEEYCREVFNGSADIGIKLVKLSPGKAKKEQALAPEFGENAGKIIFLDDDPLVVVESYKLQDLKIFEDNGEAIVCYKQLAYTKGGMYDREYIIDRNDNVLVTFNLHYVGNKWWIVDPPVSYVSKAALIDYLTPLMNLMNKANNRSEAQRNAASSLNKSIKFLTELQ